MHTQLRDLLEAAVGEPPHRVTAAAVRRRAARRRMLEYAAAISAVVVLGGLGAALSALGAGHGSQAGPGPASSAAAAAGAPRYYVQQAFSRAGLSGTVVRATGTGRITDTIRCPWPRALPWPITAAAGQTFFVVCQPSHQQGQRFIAPGARIYRFQLTGAGRVSGYTLVPGGGLPRLRVRSIAAAASGSEIAVSTTPGAAYGTPVARTVIVINTATGAHAVWRSGPVVPGQMTYPPGDLSLTADGNELVYLSQAHCLTGRCAPAGNGEEVRAVAPAAAGGLLSSSRVLVRQSALMPLSVGYINGAIVSPDGSAVTIAEVGYPVYRQPATVNGRRIFRQVETVSLVQVSATTGRQLRVLYRMRTGEGFQYRFFSADSSGRYLLFDAGPTTGTVNGWVDHGRLVRLTPAQGGGVLFEAW